MDKFNYRLYSDGACRGNPGLGGAGAVITDEDNRIIWEGKEYLGQCTNNIAEYRALILGLKGALDCGCLKLEIFLDSELLARQISGVYKIKNEKLKILMQEVRRLLASFSAVRIHHVARRHNTHADRLANLALDAEAKENSPNFNITEK